MSSQSEILNKVFNGTNALRITGSGGYVVLAETGAAISPLDATTYYTGSFSNLGTATADGERRIYIPKTGTIKAVQLYFLNTGTLGTTEPSTMSIRVNSTTDYTISSAIVVDARNKTFSNSSMSVPVTAGDYIEIKWVTPTWVTNPTSVRFTANIFIG